MLDQVVARIDAEEWDGTYPSRRRFPFADTENYVLLLEAVYQPAGGKGTRA